MTVNLPCNELSLVLVQSINLILLIVRRLMNLRNFSGDLRVFVDVAER